MTPGCVRWEWLWSPGIQSPRDIIFELGDGAAWLGVASADLHWAKLRSGNRNINVLTSEKLTDLGNSATFYSVLIEVELVKPSPGGGAGLDALHGSTV
jgi:hypothetical protein